jgi:acetyltransferase-like isoleucine patch superfamily enzyme
MKPFIHKLADVQTTNIGKQTTVWQFVVILKGATVGKNCNINAHVFIENDVKIGNNVTIKSGVQVWDGITIGDDVFIGPNVTFTNDLVPRSKQYPEIFAHTIIKKGASIGANATIIAGNTIEEYAMIGAGSVVTKNIGKNELWAGNPAKQIGFITDKGEILDLELKSKESSKQYCWIQGELKLSND